MNPSPRRQQKRNKEHRIRNQVIQRDGLICCYCNKNLNLNSVTMEHIVPVSRRGTFNTTNLTVSCFDCNNERGSQDFFSYCKKFNFSFKKLSKYKKLYFDNLKIKVLNIAKEECLKEEMTVPSHIIHKACKILKISGMNFSEYEKICQLEISFDKLCYRKKIKFCFEQLIKIIEASNE